MTAQRSVFWTHGSAIQYSVTEAASKNIIVEPVLDGCKIKSNNSEVAQKIDVFLPLTTPSGFADRQFKLDELHFYFTTEGNSSIFDLRLKNFSDTFYLTDPMPPQFPLKGNNSSGIKNGLTFWNFDINGNPPVLGDNNVSRGLVLIISINIAHTDIDFVNIHGAGVMYIHDGFRLA